MFRGILVALLALCLTPHANAFAVDRLDALDRAFRRQVSSEMEWLYNIGSIQTTDGKRFGLMVNTLQSPVFKGFLPLTLIPWIDFFAPPQVQVMLIDLGTRDIYGFEKEVAWSNPNSFSVSSNDGTIEVTRENDSRRGVSTRIHVEGQSSDGIHIELDLDINSLKSRALFENQGWVDNGELGKAFYASRTRREISSRTRSFVTIDGNKHEVSQGIFWEDHQVVDIDLINGRKMKWNWFAAVLSDQTEMMLYRLEDIHSGRVYRNFGERVGADGKTDPIEELQIAETAQVNSEGLRIPYAWSIRAVSQEMDLQVQHLVKAPWLRTSRGLISGQMLEGPAKVEGQVGSAKVQWLWAEHFNADFFHLGSVRR